eukprot:5589708-Lingulodinium_polyedra.AAC.1
MQITASRAPTHRPTLNRQTRSRALVNVHDSDLSTRSGRHAGPTNPCDKPSPCIHLDYSRQ